MSEVEELDERNIWAQETRINNLMRYLEMLSESDLTGNLVSATMEAVIHELNKSFKLDVQVSAE